MQAQVETEPVGDLPDVAVQDSDVVPRRADTTAVIGSALQASARGTGYRRIAAQLARPLSTVRRWIRAVRDPSHVEWLRTQGMVWLARVDLDVINTFCRRPRGWVTR